MSTLASTMVAVGTMYFVVMGALLVAAVVLFFVLKKKGT
jgi:hypothetical protein